MSTNPTISGYRLHGELRAAFIRVGDVGQTQLVDTLAQAQGVMFLCPKCRHARGSDSGVHTIKCWFEGVPEHIPMGPGRWKPAGTCLDDLSFVPGIKSRSVKLTGGCGWHGYVKDGMATLGT